MKWEREGWRKLYTRETATWAAMEYEGQACLLMYIRTCEPDGTIAGTPAGIARFWRWPQEVVVAGLSELVALGTLEVAGTGYVLPNFIEAQASRTSSTERSRRKRAYDKAAADCDAGHKHVTRGHTMSHDVTGENGKPSHKGGTPGDARGRQGTLRDDKIRQDKKREEKPPATTVNSVIQRGAYRAAWPHIRGLLMELQEPLRRDVSWPLTEPPYFLEAIRALGGEKQLSEALRSLQSSIVSGHIPADRWHRRMFSPGSVDGWLALLDEHRTREQAREAQERREIERMNQDNKTNKASAEDDAEWERMTGLIFGEVAQ